MQAVGLAATQKNLKAHFALPWVLLLELVPAVPGTGAIAVRFAASRWGAVLLDAELRSVAVIAKVAMSTAGVPGASWSTGVVRSHCRLVANSLPKLVLAVVLVVAVVMSSNTAPQAVATHIVVA